MALSSMSTVRALGLGGSLLVIGGGLERGMAQDCSGAVFVGSAVVVTGLALFDIATAPASARRYNERQVSIAPYMNRRDRTVGMSVSLPFGRSTPVRPQTVRRSRAERGDSIHSRRSPGTAFALSFGSTVVPMAAGVALGNGAGAWTFLSGLVVGPSVGHLYANQWGRGLGTIALRGAGTVIGIASLIGCFDD